MRKKNSNEHSESRRSSKIEQSLKGGGQTSPNQSSVSSVLTRQPHILSKQTPRSTQTAGSFRAHRCWGTAKSRQPGERSVGPSMRYCEYHFACKEETGHNNKQRTCAVFKACRSARSTWSRNHVRAPAWGDVRSDDPALGAACASSSSSEYAGESQSMPARSSRSSASSCG